MKKIVILICLISTISISSAYAGCFASRNLTSYWTRPDATVDVSYTNTAITTDMPVGTRIGTLTVSFSCPFNPDGSRFWQEDNFFGGRVGLVAVPLPEFRYINSGRMEHQSGWIYLAPDTSFSEFSGDGSMSWGYHNIYFSSFTRAMGHNNGGRQARHAFGIYTARNFPGNAGSTSQVISMLNPVAGNQINYRSGGISPTNKPITPSIRNNSTTLRYTNTVTCSVSSDSGNNIDLGVVNTSSIQSNPLLNPPLATVILKMSCGLGTGGGSITSNYPSIIIPGSVYIRMNSPNGQMLYTEGGFHLPTAGSLGLRFAVLGDSGDTNLDINNINNIRVQISPIRLSTVPQSNVDWSGSVNFIINYN